MIHENKYKKKENVFTYLFIYLFITYLFIYKEAENKQMPCVFAFH